MIEWISVKDKLPEKDSYVLVTNEDFGVQVLYAMYIKSHNYFTPLHIVLDHRAIPMVVTHWILIPEIPGYKKIREWAKGSHE